MIIDDQQNLQETEDFEHFQQVVVENQRKLNETRTFYSKHNSIVEAKFDPFNVSAALQE